jgi:hypothetical protein
MSIEYRLHQAEVEIARLQKDLNAFMRGSKSMPGLVHIKTDLKVDGELLGDTFEWTTYTPIWTANTTNPDIGNGVLMGRYIKIGKLVIYTFYMSWGSTTDGGSGSWYFSLPAQASGDALRFCGSWYAYDSAVQRYAGTCIVVPNATTITRFPINEGGTAWQLNATNPFTWAENDILKFTITYETV